MGERLVGGGFLSGDARLFRTRCNSLEHKRDPRIPIARLDIDTGHFQKPVLLQDFCEATFRMSVVANICATRMLGCTLRRSPFRRLAIAQYCGSGEPALGSRTL